jgi:hypothetical protein
MYDIFFVSKYTIDDNDWKSFHKKYPLAIKIGNVKTIEEIKQKTFTKMFWIVWDDLSLDKNFDLNNYRATKWDDMYVHAFKNDKSFDGICLIPKQLEISKKEFEHRFFVNKKEIDIIASSPKPYERFYISNHDEYLQAIEKSTTDMFWVVWPEVKIIDESIFDLYFTHHEVYDRSENHVFKNLCNEKESFFNGVVLFSKHKPISKKEFDRRYLINKKEYDRVVSRYRYPKYKIETYQQYLEILEHESQPLFWCVWSNIEIIDENIFDLYFDPRDGKYDHDRAENHVFKNLCNEKESFYNGVVLFSKHKPISKKEFDRKYLIDKKEHDLAASRYRYPKYKLETYQQYLEILEHESQPLFWGVWPELDVTNNSIFDLYFDPRDGKYEHDREENHVFKNLFRGEETYSNGIVLFSTNKKIGKREFDHRFLIKRKEHDILSSKFKPYDIVFISYNESNADENYDRLLKKFPRAKRVDKIKGIHQAHIKAAEIANSEMFWVVDGDAVILEDFEFDHETSTYERDIVHVWRSKNPINNLVYGNGGVKLLPRYLTLNMDVNTSDMTTSISKKFKAVQEISNITAFNTDEFTTWRSAFRECAKLASRVIDRQHDDETQQRLDTWCTVGSDQPYGRFAISGALIGKQYGLENKNNPSALVKINDFDWLKEQFEKTYVG